jgi:hypothetical protein
MFESLSERLSGADAEADADADEAGALCKARAMPHEAGRLRIDSPPAPIVMAGLQSAGKTATTAKATVRAMPPQCLVNRASIECAPAHLAATAGETRAALSGGPHA